MKLSDRERSVLQFAVTYGPHVSFLSPTSNREAAKRLIERGLLSGSHQNASATEAGRSALSTPAAGESE